METLKNLDFKYISMLQSCSSTMDIAKDISSYQHILKNKSSNYSVVISNEQTKARGRSNKNWHSPDSQGLYFTLISDKILRLEQISGLSLAVGVSIQETLLYFGVNSLLKWPNDLLVQVGEDYKKLAGILIETTLYKDSIEQIFIGVGINLSNSSFPDDVPGISLAQILNQKINKEALVQRLFPHLLRDLEVFFNRGFSAFKDKWLKNNVNIDRKLKLKLDKDEIICIAKDISDSGELIIDTGKELRKVSSAEILELL